MLYKISSGAMRNVALLTLLSVFSNCQRFRINLDKHVERSQITSDPDEGKV
jgi:hypothetical protein